MKQKIYETLISPKIKTNGIVLNNCIDWVCLCFDRLLLLDLSAVQVSHTLYVATFQDRKTNLFVCFLGEVLARQFCFEIYWPLRCHDQIMLQITLLTCQKRYSLWNWKPHNCFDIGRLSSTDRASRQIVLT